MQVRYADGKEETKADGREILADVRLGDGEDAVIAIDDDAYHYAKNAVLEDILSGYCLTETLCTLHAKNRAW